MQASKDEGTSEHPTVIPTSNIPDIPTTTCRGQRANDLLSITVGTQSISPFYWSIDSGAFGAVLLVFLGFFGHLTHGLI